MVYSVKTFNNINQVGLKELGNKFQVDGDLAENPDAYIIRSQNLHGVDFPKNLKAIARAGAGTNNIPITEATEAGIVVFNTPGANANAVKEAVIASLLFSARDYISANGWVNTLTGDDVPKQVEAGKKQFAGSEIAGKTLGIIGLGAIGARIANDARRLGMNVLGYDPYVSIETAWNISSHVKRVNDLKDIFENSDYITIHVPLMDSTKGMIGADAIAQMKPSVVVLNLARGPLVDQKAIVEALKTNRIRKYVTDFPNSDVASQKNAIVIPHLGASTEESEDNCAVMAVKEVRDYLENGNIHNSVNYPNCDMGVCTSAMRVAIIHRNIPNMLAKFTSAFGELGINIERLTNVTRGEYGYVMVDLSHMADDAEIEKLRAIEGVLKVRVMK
mgnify:CR=1 FL=1